MQLDGEKRIAKPLTHLAWMTKVNQYPISDIC